jgi:uncharacterized membrane protein
MKMKTAKLYITSVLIFLTLDGIWLGLITPSFYQEQLGSIINLNLNPVAAGIFYMIFQAGLLYFAILPGLEINNWKEGAKRGAFLGGLCYATYDLTNWATIENWPILVVVVDLLWGMIITGVTAALVVRIFQEKRNK